MAQEHSAGASHGGYAKRHLYRQGIARWVELLSVRLREGIANGSVRPMEDAETAAQAHFFVGARRFLEDLIRHGLGRLKGDDDRG